MTTRPEGVTAVPVGAGARAWHYGRCWRDDAARLVARPGYPLREEWAGAVERHGGLRSMSDRVSELDAWGLVTTRRMLAGDPGTTPLVPAVP